ncbi:metal-dependent hydrolase [Paenibacillus sp. LjRoot153]|uniref:metal-dependent hydrolase n=1 Tax=Paenibacillus sp. LjRoot153 TaxID=3342270 RepID=UPI003ECE2622
MTGATHVITSVSLAAALGFHRPSKLIVAAISSVICDIDRNNSLVGRFIPILPKLIEGTVGKRTITHCLPIMAALGLLIWTSYPSLLIPFILGFGSHLVLDLPTGNVALLYPFPKRFSLNFGIPPVFIESFYLMGLGVFFTLNWTNVQTHLKIIFNF